MRNCSAENMPLCKLRLAAVIAVHFCGIAIGIVLERTQQERERE